MHYWGDEWFIKNGDKLYEAIDYFENTVYRYARVASYGKEKFGTYRESTTFWDGGLHGLIYPGYVYVQYPFLKYTIDAKIIKPLTRFTGLHALALFYQRIVYNYAIQTAIKRYPEVTDELVKHLYYYELVKPGVFGQVCGKTIHKKYWITT